MAKDLTSRGKGGVSSAYPVVQSGTATAIGGFTPEAETLFAAMSPAPDANRKVVINNCIVALQSAAVWSFLDFLYVMAAHASQPAMLNWKNPGTFTLTNGGTAPTFVVDQGFTGNGTDGRLETGWDAANNGVNYLQNSASLWLWSRTAAQGTAQDMGRTGFSVLLLRNASDQMIARVNDGTSSTQASTDGSGWFGASRINASTKRYWRNGAQVGTDMAVASASPNSIDWWLCGGSTTSFSVRQEAAAAAGNSLDGKELAFYNAILAYMQAVGAA